MVVGTSYLVTLIIIILLLASLVFPRIFALPNRTELWVTASRKEIFQLVLVLSKSALPLHPAANQSDSRPNKSTGLPQ